MWVKHLVSYVEHNTHDQDSEYTKPPKSISPWRMMTMAVSWPQGSTGLAIQQQFRYKAHLQVADADFCAQYLTHVFVLPSVMG